MNIHVTCLMEFQIINLCYILSTVTLYSTGRVELWKKCLYTFTQWALCTYSAVTFYMYWMQI